MPSDTQSDDDAGHAEGEQRSGSDILDAMRGQSDAIDNEADPDPADTVECRGCEQLHQRREIEAVPSDGIGACPSCGIKVYGYREDFGRVRTDV